MAGRLSRQLLRSYSAKAATSEEARIHAKLMADAKLTPASVEVVDTSGALWGHLSSAERQGSNKLGRSAHSLIGVGRLHAICALIAFARSKSSAAISLAVPCGDVPPGTLLAAVPPPQNQPLLLTSRPTGPQEAVGLCTR